MGRRLELNTRVERESNNRLGFHIKKIELVKNNNKFLKRLVSSSNLRGYILKEKIDFPSNNNEWLIQTRNIEEILNLNEIQMQISLSEIHKVGIKAQFSKLVSHLRLVYITVEDIYQVIYLSTLLILIELRVELIYINRLIIIQIFVR